MIDIATIQAALIGYQAKHDEITATMAEIRKRIPGAKHGGDEPFPLGGAPAPQKKRTMSAAARKRIGAAQKKRWAEFHKAKAAPARKRVMSAGGRKRIAEATSKRWAALRAANAAG